MCLFEKKISIMLLQMFSALRLKMTVTLTSLTIRKISNKVLLVFCILKLNHVVKMLIDINVITGISFSLNTNIHPMQITFSSKLCMLKSHRRCGRCTLLNSQLFLHLFLEPPLPCCLCRLPDDC